MVLKANRSERLHSGTGKHKCPKRGCSAVVGNHLFACAPHWHELPAEVRAGITNTKHLNLLNPKRRAAFLAADMAWRAQ